MSNNALKRDNISASANVLMCRQWWKVCWMYGDQEKYYRQLYGKKSENLDKNASAKNKSLQHFQNFYENALADQKNASRVNESFCVDEIRTTPSPDRDRNSSPGFESLNIATDFDE
ncbi:unnamed protein product [Psylliodes chrysocephalus]|uniref:Uncharacterized protein n=1 Tax=Psylliodes chrysocephalus TaxID=3402493 RepID=A0A9P0D445_9CUCU|nr:unnamed protein product [Psylliodes chrysocephala]